MHLDDQFIIRGYDEKDKSLVFSTFLKGLYYGNQWFKQIDKKTYMFNYSKVLENLIARSIVMILSLKEDPDVIIGYSIQEPTVLHWIYMKTTWRRMGLSKKLIQKDIKTVTHITDLGLKLKPKEITFNPFLV